MRHAVSLGLALALCASAAGSGLAVPAPASVTSAYKAPRNSLGQPDLTGNWSNASLTPLTRAKEFGTRSTYTPQEVKQLEDAQQVDIAKGNAPIDNTKPITGGVITPHGGLAAEGNYDRGFLDPGAAVMRVHGEPRNSIFTTPDGQPPARKAGLPSAPNEQLYIKPANDRSNGMFDNPEQLSINERCIIGFGRSAGPPMFPNGIYNQNYQFVQSRDTVAIVTEMVHDTRVIRLNGAHRTDGVRPYFGDSIGHYQGDTLVVETTNIPETQNLYGSWRNLKVTERFTRVAKDRVLYQFAAEDPTLWDRPWGGEYELSTLSGRVMEYACAEGNYGLEGILAGARQQDADEETAKKKAVATK
jgi:hypothetical protein